MLHRTQMQEPSLVVLASLSNHKPQYLIRINMRKLIYIALLASIALTSCEKLDEEPKSNLSSVLFYKTKDDAIAAVTSVYNGLTHNTSGDHASLYNRLLVLAVGMSTDDHIPGPRATNPDVRSPMYKYPRPSIFKPFPVPLRVLMVES